MSISGNFSCKMIPEVTMSSLPAVYDGAAHYNPHAYFIQLESPPGSYKCTAALLTTFVALTSAHCVIGQPPGGIRVVTTRKDKNVQNQTQNVKQVIIHEDFNEETFENDIALLVLVENMEINSDAATALIPNVNTTYTDTGSFVKWRNSETPSDPFTTASVLNILRATPLENSNCKETLPNITKKHMCAAVPSRLCQDDSDGFLICNDYILDDYLCGIISIGNNCGQDSQAVFTNVHSYLEWINSKIVELGVINICREHELRCNISKACVLQRHICDGRNDCGIDDNSDEENCKGSYGCHWSQHACRKGNKCIPGHKKCDGRIDCNDGSDEENCPRSKNRDIVESCTESEFFCNVSTICISLELVCDGFKDCGEIDGSDELDCRQVNGCHWTQHACRVGNICIRRSEVCDGDNDCRDGSDEEHCPNLSFSNCTSQQFPCKISKTCIPAQSVCNGVNDCGSADTSDEENCRDLDGCHPTQFACHKGNKCIPKTGMCDHASHCRDGSDEKYCRSAQSTHLKCKMSNKYYDLEDICDGYPDCGLLDASDEENCPQGTHGCLWKQFPCRLNKKCIDGWEKCDGEGHCEDGSDEENCLDGSGCYWTHFACANSSGCFPRSYICDGSNDCSDGSDEEHCDDGNRCHWSEFECLDKNGCIPGHFYCDGVSQCKDGSDEKDCLNKTFDGIPGMLASYWYSLFGIVVILGIPLVLLYRNNRRRKDLLTALEIELFEKGDGNQIRADKMAHENTQFLPYKQEYEIKWKDFKILEDQQLGEGEFGVVFKGELSGSTSNENIAIKTTKPKVDRTILLALMSELKVMIHLEMHENIVKLLGACTEFLREGRLYVLVEYCPLGSLDLYLRTTVRIKLDSLVAIPERAINNQEIPGTIDSLSSNDLVNWAVQIARGMQHLQNKKIIHGDLAARNVLLYSGNQVKITDFGLSRQLLNYDSYVKQSQAMLPWRWLAIETLKSMIFTHKSDVWSYGVTLWEIFSLGLIPYPGMTWTTEFVDYLEQNLRLSRPKYASAEIYKIMMSCWEYEPDMRPDFRYLEDKLRAFFMFPSSSEYCDLNV
ncbi:unnamed protein product [Allacma fusca]|uniref:Uncharacterized protein n=1 Tax=Allacma fusca TaxID=39272 RepID=A0A8J2L787_9HEXA|nr:unnamed protein product [Allacma fusca]